VRRANVSAWLQSDYNINALQQHHLQAAKQQEMMQAQAQVQQLKIHQQHHLQLQQQLLQQQQFQQQKQQEAAQAQLQAQQMWQLQQINELSNESKTKQSAVKQALIENHHPLSRCSVDQQQQQLLAKAASALSVSSPQLLQAASPQVSQQSSTQIDQLEYGQVVKWLILSAVIVLIIMLCSSIIS